MRANPAIKKYTLLRNYWSIFSLCKKGSSRTG